MANIFDGFLLTEDIEKAHPKSDYPLYEGDLIVRNPDSTWAKVAPGIAVLGFKLTPEQEATLKEVRYQVDGLAFHVLKEENS